MSVTVTKDQPLTVHQYLSDFLPPELRIAVLDILWTLCDTIGYGALKNLETRTVEILRQEIAFSVVDIIHDRAQRFNFKATLDEPSEAEARITARLQGTEDLDGTVQIILDLLVWFEQDVRQEEVEVEPLLPRSRSDWTTRFSASYISTVVHVLYHICMAPVILLFFLADDLKEWNLSLVEEVFTVLRGLAMLQPVHPHPPQTRAVSKRRQTNY
jgi:hypothetical protein